MSAAVSAKRAVDFDVVVIGGGMVGAALVALLSRAGFQAALIESQPLEESWPADSVDLRVSAISPATIGLLERLGVWSAVSGGNSCPYREMDVWDSAGKGNLHFDSAAVGAPCLGYIVENRVLRRALLQTILAASNVGIFCPTTAQACSVDTSGATITLANGDRIHAALVVGADGGNSIVRRWMGIEVVGWAYRQHAVVATVATEKPHHFTARQRFLPSGPLAFLPLSGQRCSIVWSTSPEQAEDLLAMESVAFNQALAEAFEHSLGQVQLLGSRAIFPLRLQHAKQYVKSRVALVGDAAHTVHPLAGQGVNLGFLDAVALADTLESARADGRDLGAYTVLRRYERSRKGDNMTVLAFLDAVQRAFGDRPAWVQQARVLGLSAVNNIPAVKRFLMRQAMGGAGASLLR